MNDHELYMQFLNKIAHFEGFRSKAYRCPAGVWTCGYGRTKGITPYTTVTVNEAKKWLADDVTAHMRMLSKSLGHYGQAFAYHQVLALVDFVFNCGIGTFDRSSVKKWCVRYAVLIDNGSSADIAHAKQKICDSLKLYNKYRKNGVLTVSSGLANRREFECKLFMDGKIY